MRWLLEWGGGKSLSALAYALRDRRAVARCCVGYWDGENASIFMGETDGQILVDPQGETTFGWDPWFKPAGESRTFAEMTPEEKDRCSHRGKAYRLLRAQLDERDHKS